MMQFSLKSSLYVLVIITSCGARTESGSLKHNVGEPVRHEAKPWMWAHDTEAEYLAMGNPTDETSLLGPKKFLPADHALTQRLQTWLNEIDANVRAKDPASAVMIPKPIRHGDSSLF